MAHYDDTQPDYIKSLRRLALGLAVTALVVIFLVWRIENARVEQLRTEIVDRFVPSFSWTIKPLASVTRVFGDLGALKRVHEQNAELRRELVRMEGWREAALQLEQKNARLLALNNVRLNPRLSFVTGEIMADGGSPFRHSALVNVGALDNVVDGAPVMDGLGLVGRIAGVGRRSARIILLTDGSSRIPAVVQPSGQRAIVSGVNTSVPVLEFLEQADALEDGDRIVTSGDGGLFPPDLLIGQVMVGTDGRNRVRIAADYDRLDFVRVIRYRPPPRIEGPGGLIGPRLPEAVRTDRSRDAGAEE